MEFKVVLEVSPDDYPVYIVEQLRTPETDEWVFYMDFYGVHPSVSYNSAQDVAKELASKGKKARVVVVSSEEYFK